MAHEYKIIDRGESARRVARFTFTIDGRETKYYSPLQRGVERVIERIKKGVLNPGGFPVGRFSAGGEALADKPSDPRAAKIGREDDAVEAFLTRGRLSPDYEAPKPPQQNRQPGPPSKNDVANGIVKA